VEIFEGMLSCAACGRRFPIVRDGPRFADVADIDPEKRRRVRVSVSSGNISEWGARDVIGIDLSDAVE
jgi:hypothetical protein